MSEDPATRDPRIGCYLEIWDDKNFEGEYLRIEGPSELETLEFPGVSLSDSISSVRVGPNAFVFLYADIKFKGKMITLGPNQEVHNLSELGFNNQLDSIKLVNSVRIFDEFRSEPIENQVVHAETKRKKKPRRKSRGRRRLTSAD